MLKRIPLSDITRNPDQPRQHFDERALADLAESISINGLKQPITVRPIDGNDDGPHFMIVMGERRFRAHQLLATEGKADTILCHVRRMSDEDMHIDAILENLQRAEVSPLEEAIAYERMIREYGYTEASLANQLGIGQTWRIGDRLCLLKLTPDNRDLLTKGVITMKQARAMSRLSTNGQQEFLQLAKAGLVNSKEACYEAADKIAAKEAQGGMDLGEDDLAPRKKQSAKSYEDRIDKVGAALSPMLKDGRFECPDDIDTAEAMRCVEKVKGLQACLRQIERELTRAASVSASS